MKRLRESSDDESDDRAVCEECVRPAWILYLTLIKECHHDMQHIRSVVSSSSSSNWIPMVLCEPCIHARTLSYDKHNAEMVESCAWTIKRVIFSRLPLELGSHVLLFLLEPRVCRCA